jgi:hypothetical protein
MAKKALAVVEKQELNVVGRSPAELIQMVVAGKGNLEQLKGLLDLQKEWEANEARKKFASSFAVAQANITAVVKTKLNPQTHSKYADLGDILKIAQPVYTAEGFSVIFYETDCPIPEHIRVCADVLHSAGHKETYHYDVPLDGTGIKGNANMTKIHGKSSSVSYGRRYLMCMIWNIPTQDDDGNSAGQVVELIGEKEISQIVDFLAEIGTGAEAKFLKYMGVEKIEDINKSNFAKAISALQAGLKMKKESK